MNNSPQTLAEWIQSHPYKGPFKPGPRYSKIGDMLEIYWADKSCYAEQQTPEFTLMMADDGSGPVGVKAYGIAALVGGLGAV